MKTLLRLKRKFILWKNKDKLKRKKFYRLVMAVKMNTELENIVGSPTQSDERLLTSWGFETRSDDYSIKYKKTICRKK